MTDAPRRLLAFLLGTRCENYSRARASRALRCGLRTIDRALEKLIKCRAITRQHGGRSTPCKITVISSLETFLARYVELARYVPQVGALSAENGALSSALNLKEEVQRKKECLVMNKRQDPDPEFDAFWESVSAGKCRSMGEWRLMQVERKPMMSEQTQGGERVALKARSNIHS